VFHPERRRGEYGGRQPTLQAVSAGRYVLRASLLPPAGGGAGDGDGEGEDGRGEGEEELVGHGGAP
jgi:hypothetical protein